MGADPFFLDSISLMLVHQQQQCSLLGNGFSLLLQAVLGAIAFFALVIKRYTEEASIRRPWKVWMADSSKQAIGALVLHFANILVSYGFVGKDNHNECLFYLVNFIVDCVCGVLLNMAMLLFVEYIAEKYMGTTAFKSGDYGRPFNLTVWAIQMTTWLGIILVSKAVIVLALVLPFKDPLYYVGDAIFGPLQGYPQVQLLVIMVVIPLILNTIVYWVQDSLLMKPIEERDPESDSMWSKVNFEHEEDIEKGDHQHEDEYFIDEKVIEALNYHSSFKTI